MTRTEHFGSPPSAYPELVEGLSFTGHESQKEGQGFDTLSPNGVWGR
jgi:hypothetical protein